MKYLLITLILISSCKTSKVITRTLLETDSTSIVERDRLRKDSTAMVATHKKEIEIIKNTGITFQPKCDTFIIDGHCNVDSIMKVVNALKNSVKINKDGSIEANGNLMSAYSNIQDLSRENDSLGSVYVSLQKDYVDSVTQLHTLRSNESIVKKSKPGGIFTWWWLFPFGVLVGIVLHWYLAKKFTLPKI
jgi:hypothetical protein